MSTIKGLFSIYRFGLVLLLIVGFLEVTYSNAFAQARVGVTDLGVFNGGAVSDALAVSADGNVVVGWAQDGAAGFVYRPFRWTAQSSMVNLGYFNFPSASAAYGVNADGSVVVGFSGLDTGFSQAFRWTQGTGMVSLGSLNGGVSSEARGVSADGSVIVGNASDTPPPGFILGPTRAVRWTQATGMVSLGTLNGGSYSRAIGVSSDGLVVVGNAADGLLGTHPVTLQGQSRAFRWTQATGMVSLGALNGGDHSTALRANADGSVIVGYANDGALPPTGDPVLTLPERAFRWTQATGMVGLGILPGTTRSVANGVSADGSVLVGTSYLAPRQEIFFPNAGARAFRWTQETGMQSVDAWLSAHGVAVGAAVLTNTAQDVSADGSVVVGTLTNGHAYVARVSDLGSGVVALNALADSLSSAEPQRIVSNLASLVLHGSHSNPLIGLVGKGQGCVWASGDWGRDEHADRSGPLGLAEFGLCRRVSSGVQISASLGITRADQNTSSNGNIRHDGTYALAEGTMQLGGSSVWSTLTAYHQQGEARVRRSYVNGVVLDESRGTADTRTWAARARLDWDAAIRAAGATFSPFADLSYIKTDVDAYTETGGGFPATYSGRSDKNTEARVGINGRMPVSEKVRLLGTFEAAHRFEKEGARNTGQLLGCSLSISLADHTSETGYVLELASMARSARESPL